MRHFKSAFAATAALVVSSITLSAHAGAVYESVGKNLDEPESGEVRTLMKVQDGKLRIESGGSTVASVVLFKDGVMHVLDPADKSYTVLDDAAIEKLGATLRPMMKQLEEQMKNMPPEQRAMAEKMLGQQQGADKKPQIEVVNTARKGTYAGKACKFVELNVAKTKVQELCVAPPASLPGGAQLYDAARAMAELSLKMIAALDSPVVSNGLRNQMVDVFARVDGVPLLTRMYSEGKPVFETTVTNLREQKIAANEFEIPAGYTRENVDPTAARNHQR